MGPLFKCFGSKWQAAKHYPPPEHDTVIEPFAGGAGYSCRYYEKQVILAETDCHVHALWKWLINDATTFDVLNIPLGVPEGTDIRTLGLSEGQELLLKHWQRTNNVGTCWTISSWGNKPGGFTVNTRARVAEELHLIKHWTVVWGADSVFRYMNDRPATWFVDPPYCENFKYGQPKLDYPALGETVRGLRGQVIVCEAACPKTGAIPTWLPFVESHRSVTSRRKASQNHHSKELIYVQ